MFKGTDDNRIQNIRRVREELLLGRAGDGAEANPLLARIEGVEDERTGSAVTDRSWAVSCRYS